MQVPTWLPGFICYLSGCKFWLLSIRLHTSYQISSPIFYAQPSEVAVLKDWNLSIRPFLGQVPSSILRSAALHRFHQEHACLFQCIIYTLRLINDARIESDNACCFGLRHDTRNPLNVISHEKVKIVVTQSHWL